MFADCVISMEISVVISWHRSRAVDEATVSRENTVLTILVGSDRIDALKM